VAVRAVLREVPLDRLLLETDSPYLVPTGVKQRRNEPANIALIAARLAELLDVPADEVRRRTTANARQVFSLPAENETIA
jgi:TatD DNase family protein